MFWLLAYILAVFALSLRPAQLHSQIGEYYVCGRKAGSGMIAFSILASCIGGSATMGMAGLAWKAGWPAVWWLGSGAAGLLVLALFLAKKARQSGALTMPEIIDSYLGPECRILASAIIVVAWLAILAAQFTAMGIIIASMTGMKTQAAILTGGSVILAYTAIGGQNAVIKSDIWQFCVLAGALFLCLVFLLGIPDCRNALLAAKVELLNNDFTVSRLRYFLCVIGGSYIVCPMLFGRLLSAQNAGKARMGAILAVIGLVVMACLITALGLACRGVNIPGTVPEEVLGNVVASALPAWGAPIIMLGLFSAVISSADSCLMTAATVFANDLIKRNGITVCRLAMVFLAAGACLLTLAGKDILSLLLMANDIYVCGIVGPVFAGMMLNRNPAGNRLVPLLAMVLGGSMGLVSAITGIEDFSVAGFALSCLFCLLPSLGELICKKDLPAAK